MPGIHLNKVTVPVAPSNDRVTQRVTAKTRHCTSEPLRWVSLRKKAGHGPAQDDTVFESHRYSADRQEQRCPATTGISVAFQHGT